MKFTILNWNIGGAKFLEEKTRDERKQTRKRINTALRAIIHGPEFGPPPDVVTLQEIVQYREPADAEIKELIDPVEGYTYCPFTFISTRLLSSKPKWNKVQRGTDWSADTYFAQGNAFLFRDGTPQFPVWDLSNLSQECPADEENHFVEDVPLEPGLYSVPVQPERESGRSALV